MKMTVFWDVVPCSLVEIYRRFRGAASIMMETEEVSTCETPVDFYKTRLHGTAPARHLLAVLLSSHVAVVINLSMRSIQSSIQNEYFAGYKN
jgi:hypothetical protein